MRITRSSLLLVSGILFIGLGMVVALIDNSVDLKSAFSDNDRLYLTTQWKRFSVPLRHEFAVHPIESGVFLELRPNGRDDLTTIVGSDGRMYRDGKVVQRFEGSTTTLDVRAKPEFVGKEFVVVFSKY